MATAQGGAGNDQPETGFASEYLWQEIFAPETFLNILGRYLHLQVKHEEDALGRLKKKETMIFPAITSGRWWRRCLQR